MSTPNEESFLRFREKIICDPQYRSRFSADPRAALKEVGIDVPPDTKFPPVDARELEDRISKMRLSLGSNVSDLYTKGGVERLKASGRFSAAAGLFESVTGGAFASLCVDPTTSRASLCVDPTSARANLCVEPTAPRL